MGHGPHQISLVMVNTSFCICDFLMQDFSSSHLFCHISLLCYTYFILCSNLCQFEFIFPTSDIDECSGGTDDCGNGDCVNVPGTFTCLEARLCQCNISGKLVISFENDLHHDLNNYPGQTMFQHCHLYLVVKKNKKTILGICQVILYMIHIVFQVS